MREPIDPHLEFDYRIAGWVAVATTLFCATVIFGLERPAWVLPSALLAGAVAAMRGGFYDAAANNGLVGVFVAMVPLGAMFFGYRLGGIPTLATDPNLLFLTSVGVGVDLFGYGPVMVIFGYLGGVVGDKIRRRIRAPVGYRNDGSSRTLRREQRGK